MLFRLPPEALVLLIPTLMFALSFHEFAHAWMAAKCGDTTAARMGRLSLNPMAHLDMMGSLMILFVGFGWAKPVPVDTRFLKNPRTDMMKVAAAGPAANLILALIGGLILRFLNGTGLLTESIFVLLLYFTRINIALAVFNMIPVAPLDGSNIFRLAHENKSEIGLENSILRTAGFIWSHTIWIYYRILYYLVGYGTVCKFFYDDFFRAS